MKTENAGKFTDGKWVASRDGQNALIIGATGERFGTHVATVMRGTGDAANARLISAAPDLLSAIEAYIAAIDDGGISHADLFAYAEKLARAAIQKARGE